MGDPSDLHDIPTESLIDRLRAALHLRDHEAGKPDGHAILHQASVYRVAALEREMAIRNAREQARLDAEAGSPQPSDVQVSGLLDEMTSMRALVTRLRGLVERWTRMGERAYGAGVFVSDLTAALDGADVGQAHGAKP